MEGKNGLFLPARRRLSEAIGEPTGGSLNSRTGLEKVSWDLKEYLYLVGQRNSLLKGLLTNLTRVAVSDGFSPSFSLRRHAALPSPDRQRQLVVLLCISIFLGERFIRVLFSSMTQASIALRLPGRSLPVSRHTAAAPLGQQKPHITHPAYLVR